MDKINYQLVSSLDLYLRQHSESNIQDTATAPDINCDELHCPINITDWAKYLKFVEKPQKKNSGHFGNGDVNRVIYLQILHVIIITIIVLKKT